MASPSFTPADRIRELSAINADVAEMLGHAGKAISALTSKPVHGRTGNSEANGEDLTMNDASSSESHKELFKAETTAYYASLQAVIARLRRQAYALEEAGIISAEAPTLSSASLQRQPAVQPPNRGSPGSPAQIQPDVERITNGGLGHLDIGWLNSRGNKVGAEKEAELVAEAKELLQQELKESQQNGAD